MSHFDYSIIAAYRTNSVTKDKHPEVWICSSMDNHQLNGKKGMMMKKLMSILVATLSIALSSTVLADNLPPGSYKDTCSSISLNGETLKATCKRFNGSSNKTELPFATSCVGIISNVDGNLVCTGPTGSFARTCRNMVVSNDILSATCQRRNGSWQESHTSFSGFQHPVTNCDGNLVDKPKC